METEVTVRVDIDDVYDSLSDNQRVAFLENAVDNLMECRFCKVMAAQDAERVITCFTAEEICDYADEQELVDELTRRGYTSKSMTYTIPGEIRKGFGLAACWGAPQNKQVYIIPIGTRVQ